MSEKPIYHEKQSRMLCAVHALNNMFQDSTAYSKEDFDTISYNLSPDTYINPHKNPLGLGNYDVNVLMSAIALKDYEVEWYDKRMSPESLCFANIFGFVINKPSDTMVAGFKIPIKRPHWFSVKKIGNTFYNLDSKLTEPLVIGEQDADIVQFFTQLMQEETKAEVLVVVDKTVAGMKSWIKTDNA